METLILHTTKTHREAGVEAQFEAECRHHFPRNETAPMPQVCTGKQKIQNWHELYPALLHKLQVAAVVNSSACQLQDPSQYSPVREVPLVNFSASHHQILQLREVPLVNFSVSHHQILQLTEVPVVNSLACGMPDPSWYTGSGRCQGEFRSLLTIRSSWYTQLRDVPPACWLPDLLWYTQPWEMPEGISLPANCQILHDALTSGRF